jgi:hypothetical protein
MVPVSAEVTAGTLLTTMEFPRDSGWQGGEPDRCPKAPGERLFLTEAQMDINV